MLKSMLLEGHWPIPMSGRPLLLPQIFCRDVETLLSMSKLWEKRKPPVPLRLGSLPTDAPASQNAAGAPLIAAQRVWSVKECADVFLERYGILARVHILYQQVQEGGAFG